MEMIINNGKHGEDDDAAVLALAACGSHIFPGALNAALELDLFEIVAGACLSASQITSRLPTTEDGAAAVLDSLLRMLATYSLLTCSINVLDNGAVERRYALAPAGKFFVKDENGVSLAQYHAFVSEKGAMFSYKDAILEGGKLHQRMFGKSYYELTRSKSESGKLLDDAMGAHSSIVMKKVVKTYNGFQGLKSLVDVGGGNGSALVTIISNYPFIHGFNFDLPQVVQTARSHKGIEHIGGDMFLDVPKGDAILLKRMSLKTWQRELVLQSLRLSVMCMGCGLWSSLSWFKAQPIDILAQ